MQKYFDVGSFRVYGPYITEYGNDAKAFEETKSSFEAFERSLSKFSGLKNRDGGYLQYKCDIPLKNGSYFSVAVKNGSYDFYVFNRDDVKPRTEISLSEFKEIVRRADRIAGQIKGAFEYAKSYSREEIEYFVNNDEYFARFDPSVNPIRGSPHRDREDLFDRG